MELLTHKVAGIPQIIIAGDNTALTTSIGWFVRTGSRDETADIAGVSHFLEHMVFKGTKRRTAEQINRELDHLGAHSNAFTSEDSTVYYASVLPECQQQCLDLLTDLMRPTLLESEFETEKQVILEEIAMYDDQPPYGAFEIALERFFGGHPLASRVIGSVESVSDLNIGQMRDYHSAHYSTENMILVASGRVDVDALIDYVVGATTEWPQVQAARKLIKPKYQFDSWTIQREETQQHYQVNIWPGLDCNDRRRYALRLLCSILADDTGSRLFWELIDTGRAETASIWPQMFEDSGCLLGYLCCSPEQAEQNQQVMQTVIHKLLDQGVTEHELQLARNKICSSLILSDERPSSRMFAVGHSWLARRGYEPLDAVLGRYHAVSCDEVVEVARQTLGGPCGQVQVVG